MTQRKRIWRKTNVGKVCTGAPRRSKPILAKSHFFLRSLGLGIMGNLLALIFLIGGEGKVQTSARPLEYKDVTEPSQIHFKHNASATEEKYLVETIGAGGAFLDYDNDGYLDIYLVNGAHLPDLKKSDASYFNRLYRNNGNGTFTDVTEKAGLIGKGYSGGVTVGDYDHDGNEDLYVTTYRGNILYHNNGNGTFTDVTDRAGVSDGKWSTSAGFFDYNKDGNLDLFVAHYVNFTFENNVACKDWEGRRYYCHPDVYDGLADTLYRNNGDGTFTDVSKAAGISNPQGKGLGVVMADYDDDGHIDIFVANDAVANFLYRNRGDGTFEDVTLNSGTGYDKNGRPQSCMGTDWGDYDRDGRLDLIVTNLEFETHTLYHNKGDGTFDDFTQETGLAAATFYFAGWGTKFLDFDNDGFLDLFVVNGGLLDNVELYKKGVTYAQRKLLLKNVNGKFVDDTSRYGRDLSKPTVGRGAAFGDYDNDGDVDILVLNNGQPPNLLRNDGGNLNHWLEIKLIGTRSNGNAVGAKATVVAGEWKQVDQVKGGGSYLSANDYRLHFGLGNMSQVDLLEIKWPSGQVERRKNIKADQILTIREDSGGNHS
jgi:enediyne biosynthesis protein E4